MASRRAGLHVLSETDMKAAGERGGRDAPSLGPAGRAVQERGSFSLGAPI